MDKPQQFKVRTDVRGGLNFQALQCADFSLRCSDGDDRACLDAIRMDCPMTHRAPKLGDLGSPS